MRPIHSRISKIIISVKESMQDYEESMLILSDLVNTPFPTRSKINPETFFEVNNLISEKIDAESRMISGGRLHPDFMPISLDLYQCYEATLEWITKQKSSKVEKEVSTLEARLSNLLKDGGGQHPNWDDYKDTLIKLTSFYCACAAFYESLNAIDRSIDYLLKASEIKALADRLSVETGWRGFQSLVYGHAGAAIAQFQERSDASANKQNSLNKLHESKKEKYLTRVQFANVELSKILNWQSRPASEIANKLITNFGCKVPSSDKLQRLISEKKSTLKK